MVQSKLATNLSALSGVDVKDQDIYANITSKMNDPKDLPSYKVGSDFTPYGRELSSDPDLFNGYLSTLVRQYGVIFQRVSLAQNPLSMFRKGMMPYGGNLESIVYDTVEAKQYNPFFRDSKGNKLSPFEQNLINPDAKTYSETQDISMPVTIIDTVDTQYFQNLTQFHTYVWGKIASLVNGAVLDEFYHTKLTLSKPIADNIMPIIHINNDSKSLAKAIKTTAKRMRYFNNDLNGSGINQATLVQNIVVIVDVEHSVNLDMDYFGQLFNPENSRDFNIQYVEIDSFPSIWKYSADHTVTEEDATKGWVDVRTASNNYGHYAVGDVLKAGTLAKAGAPGATMVFDGSKLGAVVLDRDALQIWDMLPLTLSTIANPRGRYNNVFLNKKALFAYIQGLNATGIYIDGDKEADQGFRSMDDIMLHSDTMFEGVNSTMTVGDTQDISMANFAVNEKAKEKGITKIKLISTNPSVATVSDGDISKGTYTLTAKGAGNTKLYALNPITGEEVDSDVSGFRMSPLGAVYNINLKVNDK